MTIAARVTLGLPPPAYAARYAMVMQPPRLMTNMQTGSMSISKSIVIEKGLGWLAPWYCSIPMPRGEVRHNIMTKRMIT